jgi:hypothetical protein
MLLFPQWNGPAGWSTPGGGCGHQGGREKYPPQKGALLSNPLPALSAPSPTPPGKSLFAWYLHFICIAFN